MTYLEAKNLIRRWEHYIRCSAKAWERCDYEKETKFASLLEKEIKHFDISCDWPGLNPCFKYKGKEYFTVEAVVNELTK